MSFLFNYLMNKFPKSIAIYVQAHRYLDVELDSKVMVNRNQGLIFACDGETSNSKKQNEPNYPSIVGMNFGSEKAINHILLPWYNCENGNVCPIH